MIISVQSVFSAFTSGYVSGAMATLPIGPTGVESVRRHLRHGIWGGLLVGIGANCADLLYLTLTFFGLRQFPDRSQEWDALFWIFCGVALLGIGIKTVFQKKPLVQIHPDEQEQLPGWQCFLSGFLITLLNPITPVIWVGISSSVQSLWLGQGAYLYIALFGVVIGIILNFPIQNLLLYIGTHELSNKPNPLANTLLGLGLITLGCLYGFRGIRYFL